MKMSMGMVQEFKAFAVRGNVVDMAVGIIIGAAFGKIVSSVVADIVMPPLGVVVGGMDFSDLAITLKAATDASPAVLLGLIGLLGLTSGYWAIFVTVGAEQFGTNIRATVTTSVPNFVRAMIVPITLGLTAIWGSTGLIGGTLLIGALVFGTALVALWSLPETYGKDLDYNE